jgi:hypothetical protein
MGTVSIVMGRGHRLFMIRFFKQCIHLTRDPLQLRSELIDRLDPPSESLPRVTCEPHLPGGGGVAHLKVIFVVRALGDATVASQVTQGSG